MHHKRRRPKNRRAGCLMCKPWKGNGAIGERNRFWVPKVGGRNDVTDRWTTSSKYKPSERRKLQREE